jgi:PAS domain S-box-containing protein
MRDLHNRPSKPDDIADPMGIRAGIAGGQTVDHRTGENEKWFRLMADCLPMAIVYIDRDFRYRFVNKTYESWYGRTGDDIYGRRVEEVLSPHEWSLVKELVERSLKGETVVFEQDMTDRAGVSRHVRSKVLPCTGPGSQIDGVYVLISDTTEERQIETALRRSEDRYHALFENIPVGICINTPDGKIISYNSVLQRMTGYTRAEISNMRTRDFFARSHDRQVLLKHLKNKGVLHRYLVDLRRKDRQILRALLSIVPRAITGENTILTIVQDVTEYKRTEEALIESERRLTDIINFLPDATFAIDRDGRVIAWNRTMEELSGVRAVDILGKGDYEHSLPFYGKRQPLLADFVLKPDRDAEKRYSFITKEMDRLVAEPREPLVLRGKPIYIWAKASPIYDLDGNITGVIQSVRDITAQREAEERLKESEERYRTAIECSNDGVAIVKGSIHVYVNQRFCDMFGFDSPDEIIGQGHEKTIDPEDLMRVRDINQRRQRGEEVPDKYEFRGRRKDGSLIHVEVSATGTTYRNEPVTLAYLRDITERKLASDALKDSEMKFHAIFENANDAIFLMDRFAIVDCNRKALSMFGGDKENIVAQSPHKLSPATQPDGSNSKEKAVKIIRAAFAGESQFFHWRHRRFDGTDFDTEVSLSSIDLSGTKYLLAIIREKKG